MKVICWKEKGAEKNAYKMSQNAYIASRNSSNMYIGLFIYVQSNEKQVSLRPFFMKLIIEEVISVLPNTVTSVKLRAWYGVGFTSTRVT